MESITPNTEAAPQTYGSADQQDDRRYLPLKVLWVKVIIRAAADSVLYRDSKNIKLKRWAVDADRWLFGSSALFNSLESVCYHFDMDIGRIRKFAKDLTRDSVKKMEFLERSPRANKAVADRWSK